MLIFIHLHEAHHRDFRHMRKVHPYEDVLYRKVHEGSDIDHANCELASRSLASNVSSCANLMLVSLTETDVTARDVKQR